MDVARAQVGGVVVVVVDVDFGERERKGEETDSLG